MRAADTQEGPGTATLRATVAGATIDIDGVIDITNAPYLEALLRRARALGEITVDLERVPFIGAAGLSVLASWADSVTLVAPSSLTVREFDMTGLRELVTIGADGAPAGE